MRTKWNTDNIKRCVKKYGTLEEDILTYMKEHILPKNKLKYYIDNIYFDFSANQIEVIVIESNFIEEDNYTTYYVSLDEFIKWSNN